MKKEVKRIVIAVTLIIIAMYCLLFLNSKFNFLPRQITFTIGNYYINIYSQEDMEPDTISEYLLLSTLVTSPLFDNIDLLVPNNTFIPNEEEISRTYNGLYSDSVVASMTNADIIIQNYGIDITGEKNLSDFREQIVVNLRKSRPDIDFNTSRTFKKGNMEIPIIEFSTTHENHATHSFVALVNVNGTFVTVAVNSADSFLQARHFFDTLLSNMVIK